MFIEGLKQYQAIKFGEKYIVQLQQGYSSVVHIVNGFENVMKQAVVDDLDCIYKAPVTTREVTHYTDGNADKSIEEVATILHKKSAYWDDDLDEYVYPDIDTQIEMLKLEATVKDFVPVFKEVVTPSKKVEIELVGSLEDTGSDFISTPYAIGKASFDNQGGVYCIESVLSVAIDEFKKLKEVNPEDTFDNSTHSGLRYAKVNGNYVFGDKDSYVSDRGYLKRIFTTLEAAKELESIIRKFVRTRCNPYLKGNQNLGSQERAELLKEVKSVLTSLSNVESKQKTYSSLASAKRKVEDLINKLGEN